MYNVEDIRKDFPILNELIYGQKLVYLDNGATSQRPKVVIDKMNEYYLRYNANVHRGVHYLSDYCTQANEEARDIIKAFLNAKHSHEIIFTRGTTESINLVAYSFAEAFINNGDEVLITEMEHHSNIVPWQIVCERKGAILKVLPMDDNGDLRLDLLDEYLTDKVKIMGITYVSNVLGTVNPIKEIISKAHEKGIKVLVDAAQAIQHIKIDVSELDCDFLAFSAHKLYGPTAVGVLYGKEDLLNLMPPWQGGGEMIKEVRFDKTTYNDLPFKFEAGTPDFIGIIGLGEAIKYLNLKGMDNIREYEESILNYLMIRVKEIPGIKIYGNSKNKSGVCSFTVGDIHPYDIGTILDKKGIALRTGHLCAEPLLRHFGLSSVLRASIGMYNTKEEIDIFCDTTIKVSKIFGIK